MTASKKASPKKAASNRAAPKKADPKKADPIEHFFSSYEAGVEELALGLRALVRRLVPDSDEKLLRPWKTVAYGSGKLKFCAISPHQSWVNLQFHSGATLSDPAELLEGTGKSMRHVKIETKAHLKRPALAKLILEAVR